MEGTGVRRVERDSVKWFEAASVATLGEKLLWHGNGFIRDAYGIRVGEQPKYRRWVYTHDEFLDHWRSARADSFSPEIVESTFLSVPPALTIRSGEQPTAPSYEIDTGHVWISDRLSDRPRERRPRRRRPRRAPDDSESLFRSYMLRLPGEDLDLPDSLADESAPAKRAEAGIPADAAAREPLRRTPHIDVAPAEPLTAGSELQIEVYCNTDLARSGENVQELSIDLPPDRDEVSLPVWLALSSHFVADELVGTVTLNRDEEESTRARFGLRIVDDPPPGPGQITAVFHHEGRTAGQVTRTLAIGEEVEATGPPPKDGGDPPALTPRVVVRTDAKRADLTIEIKSVDGSEREFACRVITSLLDGYEDPEPIAWTLSSRAPDLVAGYMKSFTKPKLGDDERISHLVGAGMSLWRAAPKQLHELFWKLVDADEVALETIFVVSDEWAFPWELVVPHRGTGKDLEVRKPLGVEFAVGRWVTDDMVAPPQQLDVVDSYVFAPRYKGTRVLPKAADEAKYVVDNLNGEAIEPGDFAPLEAKFAERGVALAHFVCHGATGDTGSQVLRLEDGGTFEPHQIQAMPGLRGAIAECQPLVFLNACEVGRATPALVGVDGFAAAFARVGASCVIAPLWNVADDIAHQLATGLYDTLRSDSTATPAAALRELRDKAYVKGGVDSWAAYCFYGDPLTKVAINGHR
jgi:hypothetical protein